MRGLDSSKMDTDGFTVLEEEVSCDAHEDTAHALGYDNIEHYLEALGNRPDEVKQRIQNL